MEWLVCALAIAGFAAAAAGWSWFARVDQTLYDAGMRLLARPAPDNIVIVAIDQPSLDRIGRWPWRRAVHATLLERLTAAGAGPLGIDLILSEPERADAAGDAALATALQGHGRAVLPVLMELSPGGAPRQVLPAPALLASGAALGHVHVELDSDGIARSVFLREGLGADEHPNMALALAQLAAAPIGATLPGARRDQVRGAGAGGDPGLWLRDHWVHIAFLGPPGHFRHYSYVDVLQGKVAARELQGRYVLVGATAAGLFDAYPTPVSGQARSMPGVEILANVLDGLLHGRFVRILPAWAEAVASALLALGLMAAFLYLSPRGAAMASLLACAAVLGGAALGLAFWGWWFAPSAALAGLLSCYPVWSWRRLEATHRHMEEELERFGREPGLLASAAVVRRSDRMGDLVEQRIGQVRRATESLRDARRFVVDTLNGIPEGALVADAGLRVVLANPQAARLLGPAHGELAGAALPALLGTIAPATATPWQTLIERAPLSFEARAPTGFELLVNIVPFEGEAGARRGLLVSMVDITALKQAANLREETLRFVSHDLRSPLASITALLDLQMLAPDAPPKDLYARIRRYVERCLSLSDDFVQLGRVDALDAAQFTTVDLVEALRAALEDAETLAGNKRIGLALGEVPERAPAAGVGDLIRRVFANLLSNAVKYSPEGSQVRCSIVREDGLWAVTVADEGQGIAPELLPRLFGRYERLGADRHRRGPQGAGLGLVFVKSTVDRLGGTIDVQSEPGRGTRFVLRFPVQAAAAQA